MLALASVIVGCAASIFHVVPLTKNLNWMALPNGTVRSTVQTLPFFVIGLPVTQVSGPPKSPRSSTEVSPLNGYVIVDAQRFSASGQTNGVTDAGVP